MAIDIKELFVTDLDATGGYWWSKEKVDKINYNFMQLSNGGMIGPQGVIGVDGINGDIGPRGYQGPIGDKGPQGPQGDSGINEWEYFPASNGYPGYLFPRKTSETQVSPVSLKIGVDENESASINQDPSQTVVAHGTSYIDPNDNINVPVVNLRVEHNGSIYGYNFQFLNQENGTNKFKIFPGISTPVFNVIFTAQKIVIKSKIGLDAIGGPIFDDSIIIDDSLIKVVDASNTPSLLFNLSNGTGKYTKSETALEYKPTDNEITDNVLVSENTNGDLAWKPVKDVFGLFPIGSIISIRLDEFRDEHFHLNESIDTIQGSPLNNIYGRGKPGTDFEGWYLCNGETWTISQNENTINFLTPNLNNFSYAIGSDGGVQPSINVPDGNGIVIGGYNLSMNAVPNADGIYQIQDTTNFVDNNSIGTSSFKVGGSGEYCESRMIHIVYLENPNLAWQNIKEAIVAPLVPSLPTVTTVGISNIVGNTATSGGNIVSDGGANIIARGVVWSTIPGPTITTNQGITSNGTGTVAFISNLTGLSQAINYNVRAYATNSVGTSYGDELSFAIPLITIQIGTQKWLTKNSDITKYRDGTEIPEHTGTNAEWAGLKTGAWCYPDNKLANNATYGKLYNWYAVAGILDEESNPPTALQIAARKTFAPSGYHVPTIAEWITLTSYLNSIIPAGNVGGKMKTTGTVELSTGLWRDPNEGATNSSGFSAVPAGFRYGFNGTFWDDVINYGKLAYFWSLTENVSSNPWYIFLNHNSGIATTYPSGNKTDGFSVRLIKD